MLCNFSFNSNLFNSETKGIYIYIYVRKTGKKGKRVDKSLLDLISYSQSRILDIQCDRISIPA